MFDRNISLVIFILMFPYSTQLGAVDANTNTAMEPRAVKVMADTSVFLKTFNKVSMHTQGTVEKVFSNGQKLQFTNSGTVYLRRPDRMRVNLKGDLLDQEYYYNGKSITLYGKKVGYYASIDKVPNTVTAAFDYAADQFGLDAPFADFFARDLHKVVVEEATAATYLGLSTVRGIECHHLAFRQDDVDWQVWVETGKRPFPRKLVITETWVTGAPQFTVEIVKWDVATKLKDSLFNFVPPKKAKKIEFLPVMTVEAK